jgi:hypothetical protein
VKVGIEMVKASNKVRASVLAATFGLFLATTSFATTSSAATVKNGVTCKKSGQKTKSGSKTYSCEKNPYVSPTKNTWTLAACLDANDLYIEAKDQYGIFKDILSGSPEGITELGKLQKSMDSLTVLMKTKVCKKGA